MDNISSTLLERFSNLEQDKKKSKISTAHQAQGIEYAKKLGVKKSSEFGQIIKLVKINPARAAHAYSFAIDYPNCRNMLKIFFWKFYHP